MIRTEFQVTSQAVRLRVTSRAKSHGPDRDSDSSRRARVIQAPRRSEAAAALLGRGCGRAGGTGPQKVTQAGNMPPALRLRLHRPRRRTRARSDRRPPAALSHWSEVTACTVVTGVRDHRE